MVARSCAMAKCAQRDELDEHEDGVRGSRPWTGERLPNWIAVVSRWRPRPFFRNFGIQAEAAARQRRGSGETAKSVRPIKGPIVQLHLVLRSSPSPATICCDDEAVLDPSTSRLIVHPIHTSRPPLARRRRRDRCRLDCRPPTPPTNSAMERAHRLRPHRHLARRPCLDA